MKFQEISETQKRNRDRVGIELYRAINRGDLTALKEILDRNADSATARLTPEGDTTLHVAVLSGHVEIVRELVNRIQDPTELEAQNDDKDTALTYAATRDSVEIAECLVVRNEKLLGIRNGKIQIPVVVASLYGQREMVRYLYSVTSMKDLHPGIDKNGAMLVTTCIIDGLFDIVLELIRYYPELAFAKDTDGDTAINVLAQQPSAFPSGTRLHFWDRWIYSLIQVNQTSAPTNLNHDIEKPHEDLVPHQHLISLGFYRFQDILRKVFTSFVPHIDLIFKLKLKNIQAKELLRSICQQIANLDESLFDGIGLTHAMFAAVKHGIPEFIVEMSERYPDIIWKVDDQNRNIFLYAANQRQEKIFSLIYRMGGKTNMLASSWDKKKNNLLHQVAMMAPSFQLNRIAGAAFQMQRELQWYKEVESLVKPTYRKMENNLGQTPRALFSERHKTLLEEGEKWMKEMAESCTVVAALVATMMFAAAFTVPGEFDEHGVPRFLNQNSFMLFIVSDALSLFTSCISILAFLRILTSRYKEKDFLKSLPKKLMIGLFSLFFSMTTMMIAFGATLFILLKDRVAWAHFPITLFSSLPVAFFAALQFPVLIEIFNYTYGPRIFDKPADEPSTFSCWTIGRFFGKYSVG